MGNSSAKSKEQLEKEEELKEEVNIIFSPKND